MQKRLNFKFVLGILGIIFIMVGMYFILIKAGIPYQDPTLELLAKYDFYIKTGKLLTQVGFFL